MRQFLAVTALIGLVVLGACTRASSDADKMQPGTPVTATMKDGSIVSGRLVEIKADAVVIDPAEGGEWRTLARAQISSLSAQPPAAAPAPATGTEAMPAPATAAAPTDGRPRAKASTAPGGHRAAAQPGAPAGPPPAPAQPAFREVTIPADTLLHVRLQSQVASDTSRVEDPVSASVSNPIVIDEVEAVPAGSTLKGVVTQAKPSGRVKGRAEVGIRFDYLAVGGDEVRVQTRTVGVQAPSTTKKDALKIGVPAAGGAILGGILGGGKGAAIGGAVGGGAGTAVVLGTAGQEVRLPAGRAMTVKLLEPVTVRVPVSR